MATHGFGTIAASAVSSILIRPTWLSGCAFISPLNVLSLGLCACTGHAQSGACRQRHLCIDERDLGHAEDGEFSLLCTGVPVV